MPLLARESETITILLPISWTEAIPKATAKAGPRAVVP